MKPLTIVLGVLLVLIQWPLWFGHGGWVRVWKLQHQLDAQLAVNEVCHQRNQAMGAEVASLLHGSEAVEERARSEMHMLRRGETFFEFRPGVHDAAAGAGAIASRDPFEVCPE